MRQAAADAIRLAGNARQAGELVEEVVLAFDDDSDLGDSLFVPMIMGDMAGQLVVFDEAGLLDLADAERRAFRAVATGAAQPPASFLSLPWDEALAEFKRRGIVRDDELSRLLATYAQRSEEARGLMLERVQVRVRELLAQAVEEGQSLRDFAAALESEQAAGLGITTKDPAYIETVFRTNVQSAYGAGRYRAVTDPDVMDARPFVQYVTVDDSRVRPSHAVLHLTMYRSDSAAFQRIAPPNGFNCRCSTVTFTFEEAREMDILDTVPTGGEPEDGFDGPPVDNVERPLA